MEVELNRDSIPLIHALDSETRIEIINALAKENLTITQLAEKLHYSKAIISKHVTMLEDAKIVFEIDPRHADHRIKLLTIHSDNFQINLPEKIYPDYHQTDYAIALGNYFSFSNIQPTCGLATKTAFIGKDEPSIFLSAQRIDAT